MYKRILIYLKQVLEEDTTLERDMELLESESNFNVKMGIVYRSERKRIIHSQLHLLTHVTVLLQRCTAPISKTQFNAKVLEQTAQEAKSEDRGSYWYRRLVNAEYFRHLAELVTK
jgi:hypothetical protein